MELTGTIKLVRDTQEVSASFKKREFVVTTEEQYPQDILLEMTQAKCDDLDTIQVGQKVKVSINLRGREWINPQGEAKYFNTLQGYKIESIF
jgi:translation initiation factor IF-3